MALPIRELPVLTGKAARDFHKKVAEFKNDTPPEKVSESFRRFKIYWEEQERLHPRTPW
jgi:hypothetical protein